MNLKQKAVKGVFWSAIQSWGSQGISFLVFTLLARLLAPETFGLMALADVFLAFIQVFLDQGFSTAIIQRRELEPEHLDTAFWTNLAIGIFMTGLGIVTANLIAYFFKQPELAPIIRWLSLSFIIRSLSAVQEAIFRRNLAFKTLAVRSLIAVVTGGAVGLFMAFKGFGVWSLVCQILSGNLVQIIVLWWASNWRPKLRVSRKHFQDLFSFGINIVGIKVLGFFNRRSDDLLIGYFLGPKALGYYTIAYRILLVMTQLLTDMINNCALPVFSTMQKEPEKMRNAFYKATQLSSLIAFPAFLGMAALAPEITLISFGEKWLPSVPVMQILAFIGIVHSVTYFDSTVMTAMGKMSLQLKINCLNSLANIIGFAIAVRWGIIAVAVAYVTRAYLIMPINLYILKRLINIKLSVYFRQYLSQAVGTIMMIFAILAVKHFLGDLITIKITLLAICITIGILIYGLIIILTEPKLYREVVAMGSNLVKF
jgi:O-antigen/teichoic acid export membrane protein